jgi:hypothetical protein
MMVANFLFFRELDRKNRIRFFTYLPFGEYRTPRTGALLRKKGVRRGVPDFLVILEADESNSVFLWVEVKARNGRQTPEQREFEARCSRTNNEYYLLTEDVCKLEECLNLIEAKYS